VNFDPQPASHLSIYNMNGLIKFGLGNGNTEQVFYGIPDVQLRVSKVQRKTS